MKTELERGDIEAIADRVIEKLRPHLCHGKGCGAENGVFDKKELAEYLRVSEGTVNKLVSQKAIPHFKLAPGQSGGVRFYKRKIDEWIAQRNIPDVNSPRR